MLIKAACFVLGIWWVQHMAILPTVVTMVSMVFYVLIVVAYYRSIFFSNQSSFVKPFKLLLVGSALLFVGVLWASSSAALRLYDELPMRWQQQEIELVGVVASLPEVTKARTRFRFEVEDVLTSGAEVPRHISLNVYSNAEYLSKEPKLPQTEPFKAGQRWQFTVKLKRPHASLNPHGFDFSAWALAENIRALGYVRTQHPMTKLEELAWRPSALIARLRAVVQSKIQMILQHQPYVGVVVALVVGEDSGIRPETWQLMLQTGITHLMSISGLHITMLSGLALGVVYALWRRSSRLVLWLPARKAATMAAVMVALLYALMAGFSVPTQRTFYMLMVFALALWSGRRLNMLQVLLTALVVVLVIDPWAVGAAGFWLSFGAVAVIGYAVNGRLVASHWLLSAVRTQWAVTIGLLPVLLLLFHQASIVSPVANAVAIPVVSLLVTPLALLGGFLGLEWPLSLSHWCLVWLIDVLVWIDALPFSMWQQATPPAWTLVPAVIGCAWLLLPKGVPLRLLGLLGFVPVLFLSTARPTEGDMQVTILAVGQGLSVHVQTENHDLLYDAGPKYNEQSDAGLRVVLPYLKGEGVRRLHRLYVSHDDNDHSGGAAAIVKSIKVDTLHASYTTQLGQLTSTFCQAGDQWHWDGVRFQVLYPTLPVLNDGRVKDNDKSCVLKVSSRSGSVLLTGDIERWSEDSILRLVEPAVLKSTVLIVPHHGSRTSSTVPFISQVSPLYSVVSSGHLNRFRHPSQKVVQRYRDVLGQEVYRTDRDGAVQIAFKQNGNQKNSGVEVLRWQTTVPRYWRDSVESDLLE